MPVRVPRQLPAIEILDKENIFVIDESRANKQDIRPLKVAVLNLMPNKVVTETQLLRHIANTPLQVEVTFLRTASYKSKNTDETHLDEFYLTFDDVIDCKMKFDGLIITGAPVEKMDFSEVIYWSELSKILKWSEHSVHSTFYICWAAQAALYYHYGINKHLLKEKMSGLFTHKVLNKHNPLVRGFDDTFVAPHSRYTTVEEQKVFEDKNLEVLAVSNEAGLYLVSSKNLRKVFAFGHGEYDLHSLHNEYMRDVEKGINIAMPKHYYINDEVGNLPTMHWQAHESLLISNWLNYCVYQSTPFDINEID